MTTKSPRRLSRRERQLKTRRRLLDAAEVVFLRRGFTAASVEEISAEAGFTRGAFYANFEDKEQLFFDLLGDRVYREYTRMLEESPRDLGPRDELRWGAERLVERYSRSEREGGKWLVGLWLECLALAARNERFRELAADFWRGNRALLAARFREQYERRGIELPEPAENLSSAMIALDIGLFLQHLVDPDQVPLSVYPPLYELLFADLVDPATR